jgi:hypothetical protein
MPTSRNCTTALALQVFICHYFSFDWIKEYVMEKRVRNNVSHVHTVEEQKQIYCVLHFLAKTTYESFPTAAVLVELMKVLRQNEQKRVYSPTTNLDSIYFSVLVGYKIFHSPTPVSKLWKRVANCPLQYHRSSSHHYLQVKMKEMLFPYLGYLPEVDLSEFANIDWKERFIEKCIETDLLFIKNHEKAKATEDLLKYYKSLAVGNFPMLGSRSQK